MTPSPERYPTRSPRAPSSVPPFTVAQFLGGLPGLAPFASYTQMDVGDSATGVLLTHADDDPDRRDRQASR